MLESFEFQQLQNGASIAMCCTRALQNAPEVNDCDKMAIASVSHKAVEANRRHGE